MSLDTLVRAWKRPRTDTELGEWQRLERSLNAQLLGDGEGPIPPFLRIGTGPSTLGREKLTDEERIRAIKALYPDDPKNNDLMDNVHEKYVVTPILITIGTVGLALLGAAWAGYEFYRVFARIANKMRRPSYYNAEARRRWERIKRQRSESHRVRHRTSWLLPPSPEALVEAWTKAHRRGAVKEKLRLGAMVAVLEASVDNGLQRDLSGAIVGRNPGVKGWLMLHCPELLPHYSSLMRCKTAADKEERLCGLADPLPAEILYADPFPMAESDENEGIADNATTVGMASRQSRDSDTADSAITVGTESCWVKGGSWEPKKVVVAITVGTETGGRDEGVRRMEFLGVRGGAMEALGDERLQGFARQMLQARAKAGALHREAAKGPAWKSLRSYEDLLFARLGILREKWLWSAPRKRSAPAGA